MNIKKIILGGSLILLGVLSILFTTSQAYAADQEVSTFKPIFNLRTDLRCWPSYTNTGANSGDCRSRQDFLADSPPIFWEDHLQTSNGVVHRLITYWVYLSHQSKCGLFGGDHVDDWEKITVHLENGKLKHVTYNQHNGRYTLDAASVPLTGGTHPLIYTGKYSHGSYHDQRSNCALDGACYADMNYCFYWKDPRGPGVAWSPTVVPLSDLSTTAIFPGSSNPHQRSSRPHRDKVCREDGGNDIALGIGIENTCKRNPAYLKDDSMTLEEMAAEGSEGDTKLALKTYHGNYILALYNGGANVEATAAEAQSWETFEISKVWGSQCPKHGDTVYVRTGNGSFWRANPDGWLRATSRSGSTYYSRFLLYNYTNQTGCLANNDEIALKSTYVNKFVVAERDGNVNANRSSARNWERFTVELQ
jgi:hypothetical protein